MSNTKVANYIRLFIVAFSVIITLSVIGYTYATAADTSNMFGVSVVSAKVESDYGVEGESNVTFDDDRVMPNLGTFLFPGAYSNISIEIKNTGKYAVKLADLQADCISLDYIDVEIKSDDKIIGVGDTAKVIVTVTWNRNSEYSTESTESGEFSFKICYTQNEESYSTEVTTVAVEPTSNGQIATSATDSVQSPSNAATVDTVSNNSADSVKTGLCEFGIIAVLAVCAFGVLYFKYRNKRID